MWLRPKEGWYLRDRPCCCDEISWYKCFKEGSTFCWLTAERYISFYWKHSSKSLRHVVIHDLQSGRRKKGKLLLCCLTLSYSTQNLHPGNGASHLGGRSSHFKLPNYSDLSHIWPRSNLCEFSALFLEPCCWMRSIPHNPQISTVGIEQKLLMNKHLEMNIMAPDFPQKAVFPISTS